MKNSQLKKIYYKIKNVKKFTDGSNNIKTTNINILLNRIREEDKSKSKKKIILSISIIGILSFISIITFVN